MVAQKAQELMSVMFDLADFTNEGDVSVQEQLSDITQIYRECKGLKEQPIIRKGGVAYPFNDLNALTSFLIHASPFLVRKDYMVTKRGLPPLHEAPNSTYGFRIEGDIPTLLATIIRLGDADQMRAYNILDEHVILYATDIIDIQNFYDKTNKFISK